MSVIPVSADELLAGPPQRELILLCGKDGTGKTSAIISLAKFVELMHPDRRVFVLDTENKFRATMMAWGPDVPRNITYFKCENMNQVIDAFTQVQGLHSPGDWLGVESMDRIWERAQDMGYQAITQQGKAEYMEKRRANKTLPVTPKPDDLWSIVKGGHDGEFLEPIAQSDTLNVLLSTTIARPPKEIGNRKENQDRKDLRIEFGIDIGLNGAPKLPYFVQTLMVLGLKGNTVSCRVLRDNCSTLEDSRIEFEVPGRKDWALSFYTECRS